MYYYKNHLPIVNEHVMAKIASISEHGVTCTLLEYNHMEAFIAFSELSRKNVKSVYNLVKVGQKYIFEVTTVHHQNVDLSKKFLTEDEIVAGSEKYKKGKFVYNVCNYIATLRNVTQSEVYDILVLDDDPYESFKSYVSGTMIYHEPNLYMDDLLVILKQQMPIQPAKISALINITCFTGGINAIKQALEIGQSMVPNVEIQLHGSPTYLIFTSTTNADEGIKNVDLVIQYIKKEIVNRGGEFVLKEPPHII